MKKIKNNQVVDLRNKNEFDKCIELGKISKKINDIFKTFNINEKK